MLFAEPRGHRFFLSYQRDGELAREEPLKVDLVAVPMLSKVMDDASAGRDGGI